jgi:N-acyl homoserine lactone hydrolase
VRLMAFHGGGEIVDDPETGGSTEAPYFFYVVEHSEGTVLFDSGGHPDLVDQPVRRLGVEAGEAFTITMVAGDDVVSQLARAGIAPADVGHVVQSHLHYDHAGGLELFPHAQAYVQRAELAAVVDHPADQRLFYCAADYAHRTDWTTLDGEYDLFGDGRVLIVPTPGHTAGHQSLIVHLDSGTTVILAADTVYNPEEFAQRRVSSVYSDAEAMLTSIDRLTTLRDQHDALILFTHDRDWATTTRVAPERWYE